MVLDVCGSNPSRPPQFLHHLPILKKKKTILRKPCCSVSLYAYEISMIAKILQLMVFLSPSLVHAWRWIKILLLLWFIYLDCLGCRNCAVVWIEYYSNYFLLQIRLIERNCEIPHEGPFCDLMWSDPEDIETWAVSPRGAGWLFGSRVTSEVIWHALKTQL